MIDELKEWINENLPVNPSNDHSEGYKTALLDMLEFIEELE